MRLLITGGAGFIGSHIVDRLIADDHQVWVIDNYATGRRDNLTPHPQLRVIDGTIDDISLVDSVFEESRPEQVVHAAASYKNPDDWVEDSRTNVVGTINIVQAAQRYDVKRLIYFQTALCYGLHPLEQPISLSHPIQPEGTSYAISKTAGEQYVMLAQLNYISFRLANAYGPRNVSGPLPTFYQRLVNHQPCFVMDTRRDFIFINDLVDVVMMALEGKGDRGAYHISSGADFAIKDLFNATVKALGTKLDRDVEIRPRKPDDTYTILLDPSKTLKDFPGWSVSTPLETGVAAAIQWYQRFGISETFTHLRLPEVKH